MKLLAIETATEACSVALHCDGTVIERHALAPRRHAELLLPWIDELLAEAGLGKRALDAIAVGRGPGAFTGVRLAVAVVQGLAMALDRPVLPVSTLATLAQPLLDSLAEGELALAAIDARMGEVYLGAFGRGSDGIAEPAGEERLGTPAEIVLPETTVIGAGTGFGAGDGVLARRLSKRLRHCDPAALPHAADTARLGIAAHAAGRGIAPERLEPAYLRDKVALTLEEQQALRRPQQG